MKDYCVEVTSNLPDLVKQVNEMMKYGYRPIGGIFIQVQDYLTLGKIKREYAQAMLKESK